MGACEACFKSKERCQLGRDQPSCSRCLRLGKTCHPRTKKRFGRPPIVKNFDYGTSGLFGSRGSTADLLSDEVVFKQQTKPAHLYHGSEHIRNISPKAQSARVADLVIHPIPDIPSSSGKQVEHILTTEDAFFHLHRHWLIAKSLSSKYQHTVRRLFSHSPLILSEGYQAVIEQLSARHLDFKGANSTVDLRGGTKCLGELVKSSSALRSVEDAAVILMLGQIMFVYNVLIAWPCTHLIIRNTLLTTKDWFPAMLKMPEWDAATLTPVFVDTVQCLVKRDVPVLRAQIKDRIVVDRFLGVSSALLPLLYDLCVCSHRVKIYAPALIPHLILNNMEETNGDTYSAVERQIAVWEPDLSTDFSTEYSQVEASALLAQARLYKTAALILIHRLRYPLGIHDETGQSYAESMLRDISNFAWRVGNQDASGIGANFLSLLIALELPEQGSSLILALEPFRFRPNQYLKILEFVEYVRVQRSRGFDGLWFDLAEDGLFGVALP